MYDGTHLDVCYRSNKAVAVGAISFYVDHFVTGRISKFTYGAACNAPYNFFSSEHRKREHLSFLNPAGDRRIPDCFETMLPRVRRSPTLMILLETLIALQGTKVLEDREVRYNFCYVTEGAPQQEGFQSVLKYTGTRNNPQWMDVEPGKVPDFKWFAKGTQAKQINSRRCAIYGQTFPPLRTRRSAKKRVRCATRGILI